MEIIMSSTTDPIGGLLDTYLHVQMYKINWKWMR